MSDKGGSDLDIFKDLSKKASGAAASPAAPAPQQVRQKTLLGMQAPPPPFPAPSRVGVGVGTGAGAGAGTSRPPPPPPSRTGPSMPPPPPSRRSAPPPPAPPASSGHNTRPPGLPARTGSPQGGGVDMDWDDEDEKTSIYDKAGGGEDAARALLGGSVPPLAPPPAAGTPPPPLGGRAPAQFAAPPPMSMPGRVPAPPTRPTNRPPPPAVAPPVVAIPPSAATATGATLTYPGREKKPTLYIVLAALVVAAAALLFLLMPRTGSLVVTVSGPGNKPLDAVEILVNGNRKCTSSPCTIEGIKADTYYVRAGAAGYQAMADIAVVVSAGDKAVQNLTLVRAMGTGIKVVGEGTGLKLYVDGREVGPLPQEIKDMDPGEHLVRVAGNERFEPFERRITVEPEQMQTIGPLRLRVLKGLATIQEGPGAEGAKVILISGSDRRTLPRLPITLDIPTNQPHTLVATKRGYQQMKLPIKFEDGQVEKTIELAMVEAGAGEATSEDPPPRSGGGSTRPSVEPPAPPRGGGGGGGGGSATLNINSIPVSNIILDGRPVGTTPKVGLKVSAGAHSVVFVKGSERKTQSVMVTAGQTKTVVARF